MFLRILNALEILMMHFDDPQLNSWSIISESQINLVQGAAEVQKQFPPKPLLKVMSGVSSQKERF